MPNRVPEITYPGHYERRKVSTTGTIRFRNRQLFISSVLSGPYVGLVEDEIDLWSLYIDRVLLARVDTKTGKVHPGRIKSRFVCNLAFRQVFTLGGNSRWLSYRCRRGIR
jgi:hypothetical protein